MGQSLDFIGSFIVAGIVTVIVFSLNASMNQTAYMRTSEQISQDAATNAMNILQYDLYKAGYRVTTGEKIFAAESLKVSFAADLNNNGTPLTVIYTVGATAQLTATKNITDRPLFRTVGTNASVNIVQGMTDCSFAYYDTGGYAMSYSSLNAAKRALIRGIAIRLTVEPANPVDTAYLKSPEPVVPVKISKTIWPKNLGVW
jgi:Tfp pilus assembly protein PilW